MERKKQQQHRMRIIFGVSITLFIVLTAAWFALVDTKFSHTLQLGVEDTEGLVKGSGGGIAVTDGAIGDTLSVLYEDSNGAYRSLLKPSSRFYYFTHRKYPHNLEKMYISAEMNIVADPVYFSIPCSNCDEEIVPILMGLPYRNKLISSELDNDLWAYRYEDRNNTSVSTVEALVEQMSPEQPLFIAEDARASIKWDEITVESNPNIVEETIVPTAILPGQEFFVFVDSTLDISFLKRSRNENAGIDGVAVVLTSVDGEKIGQESIADDGIVNGRGFITENDYAFSFDVPKAGVYKLHFNPRQNTDFGLLNMRIGSGAVAFESGTFLKSTRIYTESSVVNSHIVVEHEGNQRGSITYTDLDEHIVDVTGDNILNVEERLSISGEGGYVESTRKFSVSDGFFGFSPDTWFNPYEVVIVDEWIPSEDLVTITRSHIYNEGNSLRADSYWAASDIAPINDIDVSRPQRLRIDVETVPSDWTAEELHIAQYYERYAHVCGIDVMTSLNTEEVILTDATCDNPIRSAYDIVPDQYELYQGDFSLASIQDTDIDLTTLETHSTEHVFNIRGNSKYALLLNGSAEIEVRKYDLNIASGQDAVDIRLLDADGNHIQSARIDDDGDTLNSKRSSESQVGTIQVNNVSGLFFLEVTAENDDSLIDFVVESIEANTDALQSVNAKRVVGPSTAYIHIDRSSQVDVTVRDRTVENELRFINVDTNQILEVSKIVDKERLRFDVEPGTYRIEIPDSKVVISEPILSSGPDTHFYYPGMNVGTEMIFVQEKEEIDVQLRTISTELEYAFSSRRFASFTVKGLLIIFIIVAKAFWEKWWRAIEARFEPRRLSAFRGFLVATSVISIILWYDFTSEFLGIVQLTDAQYWVLIIIAIVSVVLLALISNVLPEEENVKQK